MTDDESSFFFLGELHPDELANFNVQNHVIQNGDARLEVFGHAIAVWRSRWPSSEFDALRDEVVAWVRAVAACYYLETGISLEVSLHSWVEVHGVEARTATIGVFDPRFQRVDVVPEDDPVNGPMLQAIARAGRLRGTGSLERACRELWAASCDPSAQGLLDAFRSLECIRRTYELPRPGKKQAEIEREAWGLMASDLAAHPNAPEYMLLIAAAKAVRHADHPETRADSHPINDANGRRADILAFVKRLVEAKLASAGL